MTTPMKIVRFVGIAGLLGWLAMVGWAAKTSRAQNDPMIKMPIGPGEVKATDNSTPPPIDDDSPSPIGLSALPSMPPDLPPPAIDDDKADEKSKAVPQPKKIARADDDSLTSTPDTGGELPPAAPDASDDPEKAAQVFAERNQREAENRLQALTTEAERLRERLRKLETGIKRWENVVSALKSSQQDGEIASSATKTAKGTWSAATEKKAASTTTPTAKPVAATTPRPAHTIPPGQAPSNGPAQPPIVNVGGLTIGSNTPAAAPTTVATPPAVQPAAPVAPAPVQAVYPAPAPR